MSQRLHFFVLGVIAGVAATAAVFIFRDASRPSATETPSTSATSPPVPASPAAVPGHDAGGEPLPADAEAQRQAFEERLAAQPDDLMARKRLALLMLDYGRMMAAYDHANEILAAFPEDLDGLYVHGEVRLAMGSLEQAIALFDRVLAQYPDHVRALASKGRAQYLLGAVPEAIATWEVGLAAAGGRHPLLERLLAEARGEAPAAAAKDLAPLASH